MNYNVDDKKLFETINITMEGKEYIIKEITPTMMNEITKPTVVENEQTGDMICRQVSIFLGGNPDDYKNIDIRKLGAVLQFVVDQVGESIKGPAGKNA